MKKIFETRGQATTAIQELLLKNEVGDINLLNPVVCHIENDDFSIDTTKVELDKTGLETVFFNSRPLNVFTLSSITNVYIEVRKTLFERANGDFVNKLRNLRNGLMVEIQKMAAGKTFKFDDTKSPRMYYDGGWRSIIKVSVPVDDKYSTIVEWHDERCSVKGGNAKTGLGNCPTETQVEVYDLICQEILKHTNQ